MDASIQNIRNVEIRKNKVAADEVEGLKSCVDDIFKKVDKVAFFLLLVVVVVVIIIIIVETIFNYHIYKF